MLIYIAIKLRGNFLTFLLTENRFFGLPVSRFAPELTYRKLNNKDDYYALSEFNFNLGELELF